jgi:hypothetical protein
MLSGLRALHFTHLSIFILLGHGVFFPLAERKPGHPDKLFQYCSTDINTIIQRQIRVRVPILLEPAYFC